MSSESEIELHKAKIFDVDIEQPQYVHDIMI